MNTKVKLSLKKVKAYLLKVLRENEKKDKKLEKARASRT
jgi:hypothetical protein